MNYTKPHTNSTASSGVGHAPGKIARKGGAQGVSHPATHGGTLARHSVRSHTHQRGGRASRKKGTNLPQIAAALWHLRQAFLANKAAKVDGVHSDAHYRKKEKHITIAIDLIRRYQLPISYGVRDGVVYFDYLGHQVSFHFAWDKLHYDLRRVKYYRKTWKPETAWLPDEFAQDANLHHPTWRDDLKDWKATPRGKVPHSVYRVRATRFPLDKVLFSYLARLKRDGIPIPDIPQVVKDRRARARKAIERLHDIAARADAGDVAHAIVSDTLQVLRDIPTKYHPLKRDVLRYIRDWRRGKLTDDDLLFALSLDLRYRV